MRKYLETIRHLRARQIAGQLYVRGQRLVQRLRPAATEPAPPPPDLLKPPSETLGLAPRPAFDAAAILRGEFTFLGRGVELGWPPRYHPEAASRLWLYNLHYHDFLWDLPVAEARDAIRGWIRANPIAEAGAGWEPYPCSLRLVNWCLSLQRSPADGADDGFAREMWPSVYQQAQWLSRHIERHLGANHVLENAAALVVVGTTFSGAAAARWRTEGFALLSTELAEQILPDGLHYERSPMYHLRACWLLSTLRPLVADAAAGVIARCLYRMLPALRRVTHPDGAIALLNDSAFGVYLEPRRLFDSVRSEDGSGEPADGPFALPDSGYYGLRRGGDYVICDFGAIGPDHQPGHAHGDIFSFELSVKGLRLVVDTGVRDYEAGETRRYSRSTAAHNTVEIDGADQCEFWGAFRVARRGRPRDVRWQPSAGGFRIGGWHDGYQRLPGAPVHERTVEAGPSYLVVSDRVRAARAVSVASRIHLHPACEIEERSDAAMVVRRSPDVRCRVSFQGQGTLTLEESPYYPEFGLTLQRQVLVYRDRGDDVSMACRIEWEH